MSKGTYWFWTDWLGDQAVRRLTPAERGVWIDLIALAAVGNPVGYVCDEHGRKLSEAEIARVTNAGTVEEVTTLINGILEKGAASRDRAGRLFNRRMVRKAQIAAKRALSGSVGGDHTKLKWQAFKSLSQQMPQHLPRILPRATSPPLTYQKNLETSLVAPREAASSEPVEKNGSAEEASQRAAEAIERMREHKGRRGF